MSQDNGQPPPGYQTPIFNAMNHDQLVAYVPRPILCILVLICAGLGVMARSWGALALYLVLHAGAAYFTYRDPQWLPILKEALQFRWRLYRLRFGLEAWQRQQRRLVMLAAFVILLGYVLVVVV